MTILSQKKWRKMGLWLVGSTSLTIMVAWNWKLVLATSTGISLMVLVYQIQEKNLVSHWLYWREFLRGFPGKLTIAVGSGGLSAIGTYIAASIWANAENRWLATGAIVQGMGTLLILGLLVWQIFELRKNGDENQFNRWVSELTNTDSLQRLIAVRNLLNLLNKQVLNHQQQQQLRDYFQLMLSKETEPLVSQLILEGLKLLNLNKIPDFKKKKVINLKQEVTSKKKEMILQK